MLTAKEICLVAFESKHATQTKEWLNNGELCRYLGRVRPISDLEQDQWFTNLHKQKDCCFFAIESSESHQHIGNVWLHGIDTHNSKAEVRIVIDPSNSAQGAGSQALRLIQNYCFDWLGLHKLVAYVLASNPRAKATFLKAGFNLEATLKEDRWSQGSFIDVYFFSVFNDRKNKIES